MQETGSSAGAEEQAQEPEFSEDQRFHTELFGFNRVEVLTYIERISAANAEKARALEETIAALQRDLSGAKRAGGQLAEKTRQACTELEAEKKRAQSAVEQAAALQAEVGRVNDEIAAVRSRLFAKEQENAALKTDNAHLSETIDDLTRALTRRGQGGTAPYGGDAAERAALQQAQLKARDLLRAADAQANARLEKAEKDAQAILAGAQAEKERAKGALTESAGNIAVSISVLKEQLAAVDAKILAATGDLQKATEGITAALAGTEEGLAALGAQVEQFPGRAQQDAAARYGASAAQPAAAPVSGDAVSAGAKGAEAPQQAQPAQPPAQTAAQQPVQPGAPFAPPFVGQMPYGAPGMGGYGYPVPYVQPVPFAWRDEEYERYLRARREEDAYYGALRRIRYEEELQGRPGASAAAPPPAQDVRAERAAVTPAASAEEETRTLPGGLPQPAAAPRGEEPFPQPGAQQRQTPVGEAARPRYRATNGRPLPGRNVAPQGDRPAALEEQYDAVQYTALGGPQRMDYDVPAPVQKKVKLPQVPPKEAPQSGAQVPFGKPHAPRAMPFAPFDPYTPHTSPYIEPEDEAAKILNTPPPPPPRGTEARQPYVPQPTPIAPSVPLSQPYPAAVASAGPVAAQTVRPEEPVIIPYSAPVPQGLGRAERAQQEKTPAFGAPVPPAGGKAPSDGAHDAGADGKASGAQSAGPASKPGAAAAQKKPPAYTAPSGARQEGSALSDSLLQSLSELLEGGRK